jgi:hypothetical protein
MTRFALVFATACLVLGLYEAFVWAGILLWFVLALPLGALLGMSHKLLAFFWVSGLLCAGLYYFPRSARAIKTTLFGHIPASFTRHKVVLAYLSLALAIGSFAAAVTSRLAQVTPATGTAGFYGHLAAIFFAMLALPGLVRRRSGVSRR